MDKQNIKFLCWVWILVFAFGCEKKDSFPGAKVSPYIAIYDLRSLSHSINDVVSLTSDKMSGADSITGVVVSDHTGNNLPDSLLMLQDRRRLSMLRGIAITVSNASDYQVGDSIVVNVKGGTLKQKDGLLQIVGLKGDGIRKVAANTPIPINRITSATILANPDVYESTQVSIVKGGPNPKPTSAIPLSGNIVVNDGFGNINLLTNPTALFANTTVPVLANYTGVVMGAITANNTKSPYLMLRTSKDVTVLSSVIMNIPIVISGFLSNPAGNDSSYEYIQCLATQNIDFSQTPYSVVTCNNAGASTPTGYPVSGWATGGMRTYKMNMTSGIVNKGTFFYIGSSKNIDGSGSASTASSIWFSYNYGSLPGQGFGTATTNLLANSGNASGIALFQGTTVTESSEPVDVVFISNGGSVYAAGPPTRGYRITNTDIYDKVNPISLGSQPFYLSGSNTLYSAPYAPSTVTDPFSKLGGVFNVSLGRWTTVRSNTFVPLNKNSTVAVLEDTTATKLE